MACTLALAALDIGRFTVPDLNCRLIICPTIGLLPSASVGTTVVGGNHSNADANADSLTITLGSQISMVDADEKSLNLPFEDTLALK